MAGQKLDSDRYQKLPFQWHLPVRWPRMFRMSNWHLKFCHRGYWSRGAKSENSSQRKNSDWWTRTEGVFGSGEALFLQRDAVHQYTLQRWPVASLAEGWHWGCMSALNPRDGPGLPGRQQHRHPGIESWLYSQNFVLSVMAVTSQCTGKNLEDMYPYFQSL